jgi:hypothetical protein
VELDGEERENDRGGGDGDDLVLHGVPFNRVWSH